MKAFSDRFLLAVVVGVILLALAAKIGWAVYVYGDWTCAFATCRKITETR